MSFSNNARRWSVSFPVSLAFYTVLIDFVAMFQSLRQAALRVALRRAVGVRKLTTESVADAAKQVSSTLPGAGIAHTPSAAGPSAISTSFARAEKPPTIHIPSAEDPLLHLFTSMVMFDGKRQTASRVVTRMLLHIHAFTKAPPLPILRQAIEIAAPLLRCRQFKRAAKQYVFPMPLSERQRTRTAIKWIWEAAKLKGGKRVEERLAREIIGIVKGDSEVLKKKSDVHKLAVLHRYVVIFLSACLALDAVVCLQRECRQAATSSPIEPELDYWDGPLLLLFVANVHNALLLGLLWHA